MEGTMKAKPVFQLTRCTAHRKELCGFCLSTVYRTANYGDDAIRAIKVLDRLKKSSEQARTIVTTVVDALDQMKADNEVDYRRED